MNFFSCWKKTSFVGCAICGVLLIELPIPIIVNNFNKFYEKSKIEEEINMKKNSLSWQEVKKGRGHNNWWYVFMIATLGMFQNISDSYDELCSSRYLQGTSFHHVSRQDNALVNNFTKVEMFCTKILAFNYFIFLKDSSNPMVKNSWR